MNRTRLILAGSFLVAFVAGVSAGLLAGQRRLAEAPPRGSYLAARLNLTDAQQEQMRQIWSEAMSGSTQRAEQRTALAGQRDAAIVALLTDEQKVQYQAILDEHARKIEGLSQERQRAFEDAQARTRAILTPEQAARYDEMLKERAGHGGRSGPHTGRRPPWSTDRGPQSRWASQPATSQGGE